MTREELIKSPEYWVDQIQNELYRQIEAYMKENNMNKAQFAEYLGCTRGYVTQLLNGEFNHKLSKLVELSIAIGMAPAIHFEKLEHIDDKKSFAMTVDISPNITSFGDSNLSKNNSVSLSTIHSKSNEYVKLSPLHSVG